ncbi:MAG: hypothetical protein LBJ14_06605 [Desulfarculales bacterium]|jgi:hypothetical protein|nr:hypothetical protein [Desulfarculales bacterium]
MYDKKLREYTEYFAKAQALPASAALVDGNQTANSLNKGVTLNSLFITLCAQGDVTLTGISVQILHSDTETGTYSAIGHLFAFTPAAAQTLRDGDVIASFPLYDDLTNKVIKPWIKASFGGASGNAGKFDAFIELVPR